MQTIETEFPELIDERFFFQDITISQLPIMEQFGKFIRRDNYSEANDYIKNQPVFTYGSWYLNSIESRLVALEEYATTQIEKPDLTTYGDVEPEEAEIGYCWT